MPDELIAAPEIDGRRAPVFRLYLYDIALGFGLEPDEVAKILRNGRALAPFLEVLARKKLGFPPRPSTETEDDYLIVVMRENVSFARSADKGVGRKSADLAITMDRIRNFTEIGVVDAYRMPFLVFYAVNPSILEKYLSINQIKSASISRSSFIDRFSYPYNKDQFTQYGYELDNE